MPDLAASQPFAARAILLAAALVAGALVVAALALWAHYGSVVFYEMILAGIAACF